MPDRNQGRGHSGRPGILVSLSNESKPSSVALPASDTALKGALHRTGAESSSISGYGPVKMGREVGIRAYAPT